PTNRKLRGVIEPFCLQIFPLLRAIFVSRPGLLNSTHSRPESSSQSLAWRLFMSCNPRGSFIRQAQRLLQRLTHVRLAADNNDNALKLGVRVLLRTDKDGFHIDHFVTNEQQGGMPANHFR